MTKEYKSHLGLSFHNHIGELIECWQLLDLETNHAVAIADFRDGTLERFESVGSCLSRAKQWAADLRKRNAAGCILPAILPANDDSLEVLDETGTNLTKKALKGK